MKVVEIYFAKQNEGKYAGEDAIFVVMAGCNLRCSWCNNKHTWDMSKYADVEAVDVFDEVIKIRDKHPDVKIVVVTGGEPMLWQKDEEYLLLLDGLRIMGFDIHIETNATFKALNNMPYDFITISPKISEYINQYTNTEIIRSYLQYNHVFKFVITCADDVKLLYQWLTDMRLTNEDVYLMPEGATRIEVERKREIIQDSVEWLKERGLRVYISGRNIRER